MIEELFARDARNPVLTASDWPTPVNAIFNPGAIRLEDETLLLVRVEERTGRSHLEVTRSADGLTGWIIEPERSLHPDPGAEAERLGIEDPRITTLEDEHLIAYTGYSPGGPLVCLAATRDFRSYERRGVLLPPENKDAAVFPARFAGRYALIHRPVASTPRSADIWLSYSPDLRHWGDHRPLLRAGESGSWDSEKVGLGPPPLLTEEGWLIAYHGVRMTSAGAIYRVGLALLDRERPDLLLARSPDWVLGPTAPYERVGDVGNVVFPCGWVLLADSETLRLYYGAADSSVCVATASLSRLLTHLRRARG
jgi:predicted GH43/DUF377 family glycosyl hydrolase